MNEEHPLRRYLLAKPFATEEHPFGPEAWVYKVDGKIFAIASFLDDPITVSLKCDPDDAMVLRQMYAAVQPGYHLNKKHWNTVSLDGSIPDETFYGLIDHSYRLVAKKRKG
jgi:predicted DNA-binding protein (MmcQ/YjbR family)